MLSRKKNSLLLLCLLLTCCQKADVIANPDNDGTGDDSEEAVTILGTGDGTKTCPYTVQDIRSSSLGNEEVWVIGYMVGTAPTSMNNATFSVNATNQSNILLSYDSLCSDTAHCIPVELSSSKWKKSLSLPMNVTHFRKCLLVKGIPSRYLYNRKGLRSISAGLWMDGFNISSVSPDEWGSITLQ